jgi:hypothetical protein
MQAMANKTAPQAHENTVKPENHRKPNQAEIDMDRAVERVYQTYGSDLSVFFRAVQQEMEMERMEKSAKTSASVSDSR